MDTSAAPVAKRSQPSELLSLPTVEQPQLPVSSGGPPEVLPPWGLHVPSWPASASHTCPAGQAASLWQPETHFLLSHTRPLAAPPQSTSALHSGGTSSLPFSGSVSSAST